MPATGGKLSKLLVLLLTLIISFPPDTGEIPGNSLQ